MIYRFLAVVCLLVMLTGCGKGPARIPASKLPSNVYPNNVIPASQRAPVDPSVMEGLGVYDKKRKREDYYLDDGDDNV